MDAEAAVSRTRPAQFAVVLHRPATEHSNQPFYDSFLAGLEETLDRHGAGVFVQMASSREEESHTYPRWAREHLVDAVVMVDPVPDDPRPAVCASLGIPVVMVGEGVVGAQTSIVEVDNGSAMRTAVNFLVSLGHRVIGRVSGPSELLHTRSRTMAFDAATAAAGVTGWAVEGDYLSRSGAQCTRALLDRDPTPSALIYDNDLMALAGLAVAAERGIEVPALLSLLAWDDSARCRLAEPPLSVVSRDVHELGQTVAEALLGTQTADVASVRHTAKARVVARGTTAPIPHHLPHHPDDRPASG
jgi:DNA-binding LacI/PurR family transcriptional regulator